MQQLNEVLKKMKEKENGKYTPIQNGGAMAYDPRFPIIKNARGSMSGRPLFGIKSQHVFERTEEVRVPTAAEPWMRANGDIVYGETPHDVDIFRAGWSIPSALFGKGWLFYANDDEVVISKSPPYGRTEFGAPNRGHGMYDVQMKIFAFHCLFGKQPPRFCDAKWEYDTAVWLGNPRPNEVCPECGSVTTHVDVSGEIVAWAEVGKKYSARRGYEEADKSNLYGEHIVARACPDCLCVIPGTLGVVIEDRPDVAPEVYAE